jgi:hypothetical protein
MEIFISWSGTTSHKVALLFKEYLPHIVQGVDTYISSKDIDSGVRWFENVSDKLEKSDFGIICISRTNQNAPWLLFEAGALAKKVKESKVTPVLINITKDDLKGPLSQFQGIQLDKEGLNSLVMSINKSLPDPRKDNILKVTLKKWWPEINEKLLEIFRVVDPNKDYYVVAKHSKLCLQAQNPNSEGGPEIIQWTQDGNDNQKWKFVFSKEHFFQIISKKDSDECLGISSENIKKLEIQHCSLPAVENQLWELIEVEEHCYQIRSKLSKYCLDVKGGKKEKGINIQLFQCHGGNNQKWNLKRCE